MVERLGGPSVKPRQPAGLWTELTGGEDYVPGSGADLYRRSLYTFWKRTIPPPAMTAFDATSREFCSVRESRTNTPLQALALLNDELYVEAAQALASQTMHDAESPEARIRLAFQRVLSREPSERELQILIAALHRHRERVDERQAYELLCATILNLDEAVMKE